jgi:hypothetical protein
VVTTVEPAVLAHYEAAVAGATAIAAHLPRLRELALGCDLAIEFGVKRAASSAALLIGAERVISYDIVPTKEARRLHEAARARWDYRIEDSRYAAVTPCDLLFVDSLHTYDQMDAELARHAHAVDRYLVCHDTITFGSFGAFGETGRHAWAYQVGQSCPASSLGIRPAIDALMIRDPSWQIVAHYTDSHGLLVLERRS